jgi:hypothetical protein
VARRGIEPGFTPPAQFIESDRGERTDQGETGDQRKRQRHHGVAERNRHEQQAEQRVNDAEKNGVARHRREVVEPKLQRVQEIRRRNMADHRSF